jgi:dUTPase
VDDSFPDLTLPFCCAQLIMDRHIHFNMEEVQNQDMLGFSTRGAGGFGSTSSRIDN